MHNVVHDDMFTPDVIADPYGYYGRLRDEDPVHWNDTYGLWVITRHDDVTWLTRHNELFSSAVFKNDPRPAYPAIDESDLGLYEYVRHYQGDQFIQHDRRSIWTCGGSCTATSRPKRWNPGALSSTP
jgi:cytochrome P450